ncbi:hypothetical protein NEHOM01_0667 [Nematocida homosporus]|uniref:uncharacterized protein n=1 Tax=Nematocida homosporus TaxID=1912981 RepID=UPI00221F4496|nr:uncharacterized protein NEHOM01_0667 [Nematocida homosporus]KAI5185209.1 hypothetical protein NEHOM01_0667 [Nematocida homosporus]
MLVLDLPDEPAPPRQYFVRNYDGTMVILPFLLFRRLQILQIIVDPLAHIWNCFLSEDQLSSMWELQLDEITTSSMVLNSNKINQSPSYVHQIVFENNWNDIDYMIVQNDLVHLHQIKCTIPIYIKGLNMEYSVVSASLLSFLLQILDVPLLHID